MMVELQEIYDLLTEMNNKLDALSRTKHQKIHAILGLLNEKDKVSLSEIQSKFNINSRTYAIDLLKSVGSYKGMVFVRGDKGSESFVCRESLLKDWELVVAQLTRRDYERNRVVSLDDLKREHDLSDSDLRLARSKLIASGLWHWNPNNPAFIKRVK